MNKMTHDEMLKYSAELVVKNNSDEAVKLLVQLQEENELLKNKIDKAIEYIEKHKEPLHHSFDEPDCDYWIATNPDDLLDILRGEDSE